MKKAIVIPLSKMTPRQVRLITVRSITRPLLITMECVAAIRLSDHMGGHHVFCPQHGFWGQRSCVSKSLLAHESWLETKATEHCTDFIFVDFNKASETVPHGRLLLKLQATGIDNPILCKTADLRRDHSFSFRVVRSFSRWFTAASGVPRTSPRSAAISGILVSIQSIKRMTSRYGVLSGQQSTGAFQHNMLVGYLAAPDRPCQMRRGCW